MAGLPAGMKTLTGKARFKNPLYKSIINLLGEGPRAWMEERFIVLAFEYLILSVSIAVYDGQAYLVTPEGQESVYTVKPLGVFMFLENEYNDLKKPVTHENLFDLFGKECAFRITMEATELAVAMSTLNGGEHGSN